ncbi:hypothetical protein NEIRO03_0481 [Nematocida sp. AWRm78]|nr:hypothetical protein NEIRO03_0481 [Nematocida sp. AWRm78]
MKTFSKNLTIKLILTIVHMGLLYIIMFMERGKLHCSLIALIAGTFAFKSVAIAGAAVLSANFVRYSSSMTTLPMIGIVASSISDTMKDMCIDNENSIALEGNVKAIEENSIVYANKDSNAAQITTERTETQEIQESQEAQKSRKVSKNPEESPIQNSSSTKKKTDLKSRCKYLFKKINENYSDIDYADEFIDKYFYYMLKNIDQVKENLVENGENEEYSSELEDPDENDDVTDSRSDDVTDSRSDDVTDSRSDDVTDSRKLSHSNESGSGTDSKNQQSVLSDSFKEDSDSASYSDWENEDANVPEPEPKKHSSPGFFGYIASFLGIS